MNRQWPKVLPIWHPVSPVEDFKAVVHFTQQCQRAHQAASLPANPATPPSYCELSSSISCCQLGGCLGTFGMHNPPSTLPRLHQLSTTMNFKNSWFGFLTLALMVWEHSGVGDTSGGCALISICNTPAAAEISFLFSFWRFYIAQLPKIHVYAKNPKKMIKQWLITGG